MPTAALLLAAGPNPAAGPMTYILPLAIFVSVILWGFFQRKPH